VDAVVAGNVQQTAPDAAYLPRHVALRLGMRDASTALGVNRLCGSGFQAAISAVHTIRDGAAGLVLAVGAESMSQAPLSLFGQQARFGTRLGAPPPLVDTLSAALSDSLAGCSMGDTAEEVARRHGVTREDADAYALASQQRLEAARAAGRFAAELAPLALPAAKRGGAGEVMAADETPRPATTAAALAKLAPVFKGVVTAGNASGIADGAGALLLASEAALAAHKQLVPLAELRAWAVAGVDPRVMGLGPVPALVALTQSPAWPAGLALADVRHVEINEAFAPQVLGCVRALAGGAHALDPAAVNPDGGAIAVGHPLGASGVRILAHIAHTLAASGARYGIGAACIGGGQGIAVLLENPNALRAT
jgi:acetyl-CoA acetyltransferase family protein